MKRVRNNDGTFALLHGMKKNPLYRVWCAMKERCNNPHNKSYKNYGGKGIKVCEEWAESFLTFYEWSMKNGYKKGLTIDRINYGKGYSPNNCRWATVAQQNRNYSRNHNITYNGQTHCIQEWSEITGIKAATIQFRIKSGKPLNEVFSKIDGRTTRWKTISPSYTQLT